MAHCLLCTSAITEDVQHYITSNIGLEITLAIEQYVGYQINEDGAICAPCFNIVLDNTSVSSNNDPPPTTVLENTSSICIWCQRSLQGTRNHSIGEGAERQLVSEQINPRTIPPGSRVCYNCWVRAQGLLQSQGIESVPVENTNRCVWCKKSLHNKRTHSLPEGPERDEIIRRISPRHIPLGGLVCYACWVSARRNVQRIHDHQMTDELLVPGPSHSHFNETCAWCRSSLFRILTGPERDEVAARIYPIELPQHAFVCSSCYVQAEQNLQIQEGHTINTTVSSSTMTLDNFSRTANSSSQCFVPGCTNPERLTVPEYIRIKLLKNQRVFVTSNAKICAEHQSVHNWEFLDHNQFSKTFNKEQMEAMMMLSIRDSEGFISFSNYEWMDDNLFKYWTGLNKNQYTHILNIIRPAFGPREKPKTALGIYLIKMRTGDSHERISSLLQTSKTSVSRLLDKAREAIKSRFVPLYLGLSHLTREDLIMRNLIIPEGLFGDREDPKPIVICDGTYIYLQKSSNYNFQKKTYSLHKFENLVKPFLIVTTDGYIIDAFGPYEATKSDADIMKHLFQDPNSTLRQFFRENDIFILDRGFRNVLPFLQDSLGFKVYKPESLEQNERQLPTEKANKSRFVTLCRWVVEIVNGRFKRDYKIFRQEYFNTTATHLMDDFRNCAAFINAFHPVITDRPDAEIILNRALERKNIQNVLGNLIISNRINRFRAQFTRIDAQLPELDIFPQMTMSDLIIFALGVYQIKQARSYYGEHIRQHGSFEVEISNELEIVTTDSLHETVLLRGRIRSRHQSGKVYYTYILLARHGVTWENKIVGYYCNCICGLRTVGCCAHVMTIIWYLGWARYENNIEAPARFLDGIFVREEIEEE